MPILSLRVETRPGHDLVTARGELAIDTHEQLRALRDSTGFTQPVLVLDLLGVGFMDSLGLGALVVLRRSAERRGAALVLVADGAPARLVRVAGLDELVPLLGSQAELGPARLGVGTAARRVEARPPDQPDRRRLVQLMVEVRRARAACEAHRSQPPGPLTRERTTSLASGLARAMQAYADTAAALGVPLPYRYRDEMRLYRAIAADAGAFERLPGGPH